MQRFLTDSHRENIMKTTVTFVLQQLAGYESDDQIKTMDYIIEKLSDLRRMRKQVRGNTMQATKELMPLIEKLLGG